ncbi:glycosyltransferase family 4 protein [Leifsonia sp. NPDC080035]|uniref:D-inositol 3-phosphate glycosyltransferase n=1 Tax=Leifsonia sp. NPDC080035 TaxID=3143936 RepID=A0AAU7GCW5_9MICO
MRILMVSQYYRPEGAHVVNELAETLAERGHEVVVLTGFPNYPAGVLFEGYRQSWRSVESDGAVTVRRVPLVTSHSSNPLGRILNYASFALSTLTASGLARRADVVYVYATQMTAALAPAIWRAFGGAPYVLHVQDLWPESITESGMLPPAVSKTVERSLSGWLRWTYQRAAATIAIAPTMLRTLRTRGVPRDRGHVVFNWGRRIADPTDPAAGGETGENEADGVGLDVMYAGTLGDLQDLDTAIHAAHLASDLEGFTLHIVGGGLAEPRLRRLAEELGTTNVRFHGLVPSDRMAAMYRRSHFQLVPLRDIEIFRGTIPSKFQASMSLGIPVVTTVAGDLTEIVRTNELGFAARPEDPASLARAFREAHAASAEQRSAFAERALDYYDKTMTRETSTARIEQILATAATEGTR